MADNRFNQVPGYGGGGFQVSQQNAAVHNVPGMAMYMQGGMPMNPMMQQQMLMASGMRFPMQSMRMGLPSTPPPPYSVHATGPGIANFPYRPRTLLNKSKEGQQSEKERFYEEQRQKLKQFGKPGSAKVDAEKLIGPIFSADEKSRQSKTQNSQMSREEDADDGFGDFLQGPALTPVTGQKDNDSMVSQKAFSAATPEHEPENQEEKKDLKSIMLEYSDLSAPKKAKGFHKPTLNEVQKSGQRHHKVSTLNIHESDHSRSWKQNTDDLEGLFQIPVAPKQPAQPVCTIPSQPHHFAYVSQHVVATGLPPVGGATGSVAVSPPSGPPPSYGDVVGSSVLPTSNNTLVTNAYTSTAVTNPGTVDLAQHGKILNLPEWCFHNEDQLPAVYKQVYEASIVKGKISTERLYPILLLSGLPREKLAQIWSLCNTATPGQLAKSELWLVLALISLTQNNYQTGSLDILARCPVPPVPVFAQVQDISAPATLPTTPQQHQTHPPHQSLASASHPPSQQQQHQHQPHHVQQPKPQLGSASLTSAGATSTEKTSSVDDDFADFQHAAPVANTSSVSFGKDEAFGEFIGGSGRSSFNFSPLPTLSVHGQMGNGSVVTGYANPQSQLHQPQQQQDVQQQSAALPSLPVDDKYGTNVRSFFCSSDSSAGHTSPSFEDDDFTDGRDSLSQVSTSEPSENEDIRNFENYVEEFHQQKGKPDGSPLHCPFPTIQQKQAVMSTKLDDSKHSGKLGAPPRLHLSSLSPVLEKNSRSTNAGFGQTHDASSDFTDFKGSTPSFKMASVATAGGGGFVNDSDFADFKSASFQSSTASDALSSNDVSLIGDEDRYGALRALSLGGDFTQHSLFEDQGHASASSATSDLIHETSQKEGVVNEEDDWADFSTAANIDEDIENQNSSLTSAAETTNSSTPQKLLNNKDNILKMFSSLPVQSNVSFAGENSSDISSERGSKIDSLFGDAHNSASTPSKHQDLDSSISGNMASYRNVTDQDITNSGLGWNKNDHHFDDDRSSLSNDDGGDGLYHRSDYAELPASTFERGISSQNSARTSDSAGSSIRAGQSHTTKVEDDWRLFRPASSPMSSATASGSLSESTKAQDLRNKWGEASHLNTVTNTDEDDWCDFSAASAGSGVTKAGAPGGGTEEAEVVGSSENIVTIKKQNLGTSEIMGLFKVRDDPATLSSYQLPTQPQTSKSASRHGSHHSRSPSHRLQRSLDYDDDMVPPPMDFGHDDDYDDHVFSRGYDLDDFMQQAPPVTVYSPFGISHSSAVYSQSGGIRKVKDNKEDSGSVHSLDLPSARPGDQSGSDSQSVSSADLTGAEVAGTVSGVVSVESKSVDSLDLRSDNGDYDSSDVGSREDSSTPAQHHHHPIQPQELLATMPDFADKYNIEREAQTTQRQHQKLWEIMEKMGFPTHLIQLTSLLYLDQQAAGSDRYGWEWERCLSNCYRIISEANTLFNTVSSSSVCNEVLKSAQGSEYVSSVIEIYRVVCRILTSMRSTAISTTEVEQTLKSIDLAWNNLSAFLAGASLLPKQATLVFTNCILKSDSEHAQDLACGVCLLNVDAKPLSDAGDTNSCKLTYAGRQYHATCANFWVNCVDQTLPSLTLPDLL